MLVELELRVVGSHKEVVVRGLIGEMMVSGTALGVPLNNGEILT
jgi:hypothetical protein